ncbi:MAG: DNA polymerase domain-containing protein [Methanosarcinales archaeon]
MKAGKPTMVEAIGDDIYQKVGGRWRWVSKEENYYFVEDERGEDGVGLWNERLRKVIGRRSIDPYARTFEQDLSPLWRYCLREKPELDLNKHVLYFDIEVAVSRASELQDYSQEVVSVALTTNRSDYSVAIVQADAELDADDIRCIGVSSERELIQKLLRYAHFFNPDVVCGWYSNRFDVPYLIERSRRSGIDFLRNLSPFRKAVIRRSRRFASVDYIVRGLDLLDMMDVYISVMGRPEVGLSLDAVAQHHLNVGKIKVDRGNIRKLLEEHPAELVRYNVRDVELLKKLDMELSLIASLAERQQYAPLPLRELSSNSRIIDYLYIEEAHSRALRVPSKRREWNLEERSKFSGALVLQPEAGVYSDVAVLDFKSMYPSIIISENISPEVHSEEELGILPTIVKRLMELRQKYKSKEQTPEVRRKYMVAKGLVNSTYGVIGFRNFRLFNRDLAERVTSKGRQLLMETVEFLRSRGFKVVYGDTDSLFVPSVKDPDRLVSRVNDFLGEGFEVDLNYHFKRLVLLGKKKKWIGLKEDGSIEMRGIAAVRKDMPLVLKDYLTEAIRCLVSGRIDEYDDLKDRVLGLDPSLVPISELVERTKLTKGNPHTYWARAAENTANIFGYRYLPGEEVPWLFIKDPKLEVIAVPPDLPDSEIRSRWDIDWRKIVDRWFLTPLRDLERVLITPQRRLGDY